MISHIVLFRPRGNLSVADRIGFADALLKARQDIPTIRGFRIGRRVTHGAAYEALTAQDFPYAAVIDFDDLQGLQAYLAHPAHDAVGTFFATAMEAALVYDYEMAADLAVVRALAELPPD
jgi:hypothetical protein